MPLKGHACFAWPMRQLCVLLGAQFCAFWACLVLGDDQLGKLDCCTMLWGGWTDVSNNSIYVLMLLHSMNKSEMVDIVNVSSEHHQSDFLLKTTKEILAQCSVNMNVIECVVTDSPTPMLKYRHLLSEKYSHIVPLSCTLHVANLLTKDICRLEGLTDIVKGNCKIVNFFT